MVHVVVNQISVEFSTSLTYKVELTIDKIFSGARGLRSILENVLMDIMYEVPGSDITQVTITREVVERQSQPLYKRTEKEDSSKEEKTATAVQI